MPWTSQFNTNNPIQCFTSLFDPFAMNKSIWHTLQANLNSRPAHALPQEPDIRPREVANWILGRLQRSERGAWATQLVALLRFQESNRQGCACFFLCRRCLRSEAPGVLPARRKTIEARATFWCHAKRIVFTLASGFPKKGKIVFFDNA